MEALTIQERMEDLARIAGGRILVVWPFRDEEEISAVIREFEASYGKENGLLVLVKDYSSESEPLLVELSPIPSHVGREFESGRRVIHHGMKKI